MLVATAKKRGQSYCAISDYQTMTGFPDLAQSCQKAGLTPCYAMDLEIESMLFTCVVLSEEGYRNLMKLGLLASKNEQTIKALQEHEEGLYVILDMASAPLMEISLAGEKEFASRLAALSRGIKRFALGIPYSPFKMEYIAFLREFCQKFPYDTLAFPHVRYLKSEDAIALSIVEAIASDSRLDEKIISGEQYYLDEAMLTSYYSEEELRAPLEIAKQSAFVFAKKRGSLPHYPTPDGKSSSRELREQAYAGLARRKPDYIPVYQKRLEYELSIIEKMGYCDYFLIVADYVSYAKKHGISVGPGRGSGAGSLVSFALGIVTPDPLQYGLLFERFLNPERQSMPDIDVDFADVRRDEIALYLQEKYGHDRVAHIVTMQTLGAKASIRDVGRVFGYEPRHIDTLAKAIGNNTLSLRENYKTNTTFRTLVDSDPYYLQIVSHASKIEGLPRQAGLHAAGIVLSEEPLENIVPIAEHSGVGYVAEYEMNYLEEQGVLKMDLLGLRNLTLVDHCLELVEATRGIKIDYATIPYEDPKAIALIASCHTMGLFQLESAGMNRAISTVKPTSFSDLVAIISLFRPGPMENIPTFARRKAGKEPITYLSPLLEPILKETYGVIVYQEQIMQIARTLAGFSYGQADLFRRAVSKKDAIKLAALREGFLQGCTARGVEPKIAVAVYDLIFKFADYGFNKSHAVAYGILASQMAYLKCHYPLEFYCAILDGTSSNDPKFPALTNEIKQARIGFALPSVNLAHVRFIPHENKIVFPFSAIKGIGGNFAYRIVEERELNGPYQDFFDFTMRNKKYGLTVASLVKLIDAGVFDEFGIARARLRLAADSAISYAEMFAGVSGQEMLLGLNFPRPEIPYVNEDKMSDLLYERDALGLMISGSPLQNRREEIQKQGLHRLSELPDMSVEATYAGVVATSKTIVTKKGTRMAFVTLYDEATSVEVAMFAEAYDQAYPYLKDGTLVKARIHKNRARDGFTATSISPL